MPHIYKGLARKIMIKACNPQIPSGCSASILSIFPPREQAPSRLTSANDEADIIREVPGPLDDDERRENLYAPHSSSAVCKR